MNIKLNERQKRFCDEYIISLNATDAAIKAGYSEKTARFQAAQILTKLNVQEYISERLKAREKRTEITQDRVLKELGRIAFLDIRKLFDENGKLKRITDLDDDTAAAIAGLDICTTQIKSGSKADDGEDMTLEEITKKIKNVDKKGALELLGRNLSMWHDKVDLNVKGIELIVNGVKQT